MGRKESFSLRIACQLINVQGMIELENHRLAVMAATINSAKKRQ